MFSTNTGAAPAMFPLAPHAAIPYSNGGAAAAAVGHAVAPPALALEIRLVSAANYEAQLDAIGSLLPKNPFVSIDTEYPGTVHRPRPGMTERQLAPPERYALVKANVDELPVVQLGITLSDGRGNLPVAAGRHSRPVQVAWEVTFSDFDARRHRHAPDSVAFLRSQGVDFDQSRAHGVSSAAFAAKLAAVLAPARLRGELTWAAFGGAYDFAYMVKMLSGGQPLPATWHEFMARARDLLGGRVFDVKYMAEHSGRADLCVGGGLRRVAACLGVPPVRPDLPSLCLAGAKSRTACHIYTAMTRHFNEQDHDERRHEIDEDHSAGFHGLIDGFH